MMKQCFRKLAQSRISHTRRIWLQQSYRMSSAADKEWPTVHTTRRASIRLPSSNQSIPLTVTDIHLRHEQLPFCYFFEETLDADLLTKTLTTVLQDNYGPVGGRIHQHLAIQCGPNDRVPLSFGKIDMSLEEWKRRGDSWGHCHAASSGIPRLLPLFDSLFPTDDQSHLLTIRVTYFTCGGTAIGVNVNHALGDTASCVDLVKRWGRAMRNTKAQSNHVCWKRALANMSGLMMTPDLVDLMGLDRPEQDSAPNISYSSSWINRVVQFFSGTFRNSKKENISSQQISPIQHEYVRLLFSPTLLQAMKAHGMAGMQGDSFVSTNDMVSASGWLMKRVLSNQPEHDISVVVNLRGHFGIAQSLFGNGITNVIATLPPTTTSGHGSSIQISDIREAARSIRQALTRGMLDFQKHFESARTMGHTNNRSPVTNGIATFSTTSWSQFPLWKIRFGKTNLSAFHGQPAHPLPAGSTFASVISAAADGGCVYELFLPSGKAQEARTLHRELQKCYLDWYSTTQTVEVISKPQPELSVCANARTSYD